MGEASTDLDRELAASALEKRRRKERPTARELAALRRVEAQREEQLRWTYYATVPKRHYQAMAGRQSKVLNEQADRYGLPLRGRVVDLREVLRAFHDLLAANRHRLATADRETVTGSWVERYRREKALLARMERQERAATLIPRALLRGCLSRLAAILRRTADTLQRHCGPTAHEILSEGLDDAEAVIRELIDESEPPRAEAPK